MERKACTFFGHRTCPASIEPILQNVLDKLISQNQVNTFYVGNHGQFDALVYHVLQKVKKKYPHIQFSVVLAYLPSTPNNPDREPDSIFPEGLETVPPKYAIYHRNKWMLQKSEMVICYVEHQWGGAAQFMKMALQQKKEVINLCTQKERGTHPGTSA